MSAGKGDALRPVDAKVYGENYDAIFRKPQSEAIDPYEINIFGMTSSQIITALINNAIYETTTTDTNNDKRPQ